VSNTVRDSIWECPRESGAKNIMKNKSSGSGRDPLLFATNLKFLLSFLFLVFFAVGNFLIMNDQIRHANKDALIISFMESQYSLVQKTTFLSISYAQSMDPRERSDLRKTIHEELTSLLVFGTTSNDIFSEKTGLSHPLIHVLRGLYHSSASPLNGELEDYVSALKKFLIGSPVRVRADNLQLVSFQTKSTRLLGTMRSTIKKFQKNTSSQILFLQNVGRALFVLDFFCLGLIGALVFLPTLGELGIYLQGFKNINEALELKVAERTAELEQKSRQIGLSNAELRDQIEQRIRIEKELRQTNSFLDSIIENIPDMVFIKEASELRFVRFNRAGEELIGHKREDLLGKNDYSFFPKAEADFFVEKDKKTMAGGTLLEIAEESIHTSKKGVRILHTKKIPIFDMRGKPAYLLGISEDITERIRSEKQMRDFSIAMENALDGIARMDPQKKILSVNKAYAAMMGYTAEEMVGLNRMTTICPEDSNKASIAFDEMKRSGKAETEVKALRKNGSIFHQYVCIVRAVDKNGDFDGFYCFAKDVTEHKYREALEIKAELIQMVSHELRTPIHSVKEGLSIILEGLTGEISAEQKEVLNISKRCVDRLVRLVNDVLAFHKMEAGVLEFHMKKEDLNKILKEAGLSMRPLIENKNLHLKLELDAQLPEVELDHDKILQVLTNLIQNAIKFTLQGEISLISAVTADGVRISVKDTGIGVQQQDVSKLFRKFGQLESAKLVAPGGTGLGLAISKKIVEEHHGNIEIESQFKKGSIFSFVLPLEQPKSDRPSAR